MEIDEPYDYESLVAYTATSVVYQWLFDAGNNLSEFTASPSKGPTIRRTRRSVDSIVYELGGYARRYYRMEVASFWNLHAILKHRIDFYAYKKLKDGEQRRVGPNGNIPSSIRLSAALRYFAGGEALDIALIHGISFVSVFRSVWAVVDAVNDLMVIKFPESHAAQREIARRFTLKSQAGFDICVGPIDGMLIWIPRPPEADCIEASCGPKKFFCGRKKKFGLGMQAVCDDLKRFWEVSIGHTGSTSDYMAFVTSKFYFKLEQPGFLAPGLALFGDNAYVSNAYMVTPIKMAQAGSKDAFNFYQSQLRINIECAFGMLVKRWGILRKCMPMGISIKKTNAMVYALCKLHNFCINEKQSVPPPAAQDDCTIGLNGGLSYEDPAYENNLRREHVLVDRNESIPTSVLGSGEHMDDYSRNVQRQDQRHNLRDRSMTVGDLPQTRLLHMVIEKELERPRPQRP